MSKPFSTIPNNVPAIDVQDLSIRYESTEVLSHITFQIYPGEITAIIGPNGSGKTTLLRAMLGLIPSTGMVLFQGQPLAKMRAQIGYLPQRFQFDRNFPITVAEYFSLTSQKKLSQKMILDKMAEVGLPHSLLAEQLGSLSGGELQRSLMVHATLHNPSILILDEPSTGIDIVGEQQFYELIQAQRTNHKTTILLVSHDIAVVSQVVDKVVCINKKMICFGPPKIALTEEKLSELYGEKEGHGKGTLFFHHRHHS